MRVTVTASHLPWPVLLLLALLLTTLILSALVVTRLLTHLHLVYPLVFALRAAALCLTLGRWTPTP